MVQIKASVHKHLVIPHHALYEILWKQVPSGINSVYVNTNFGKQNVLVNLLIYWLQRKFYVGSLLDFVIRSVKGLFNNEESWKWPDVWLTRAVSPCEGPSVLAFSFRRACSNESKHITGILQHLFHILKIVQINSYIKDKVFTLMRRINWELLDKFYNT